MRYPGLSFSETQLLNRPQKLLLENLRIRVAPPSKENSKNAKRIKFNGIIKSSSFLISSNVTYPQYFIPMIKGEFIEGETETLLKLEYDLPASTKVYLNLWVIITILSIVYCIVIINNILYASTALSIFAFNYIVVYQNFIMHMKKSKESLLQILNS